jgi:hypothetical protein
MPALTKNVHSIFAPAKVTSAYLKAGLTGFAGSGKTKTATIIAIGMIKLMRELRLPVADKPVYFLDTETGSDWVKKDFDAAGIGLETAKTRSFADLVTSVAEAQAGGSMLLVDSATHFWQELCETYQRMKARERRVPVYRLQFQDWGFLKGEWRKFTEAYVNSPLHIVIAGRAAYEYDYFEDDDGKKQLEKTDVKMSAEKEMGYEPSLSVLMERHTDMATMKAYRTATVLKDRGSVIDGKQFRDPTFADFLPHIQLLNLGGEHIGVDATRNSSGLIPATARDNSHIQRKIVLDEIESLMALKFPSTSAKDKTAKLTLLLKHFKACWTEMEELMPLIDLRMGYDSLHLELEGVASRYGAKSVDPAKVEINDSLPDSVTAAADPLDIPASLDRRFDRDRLPMHMPVTNGQIPIDDWLEDARNG